MSIFQAAVRLLLWHHKNFLEKKVPLLPLTAESIFLQRSLKKDGIISGKEICFVVIRGNIV